MPVTKYCQHPDELAEIAGELLDLYPDRRIFAFYGSMGAGKTTFIRKICTVLGVADTVNSPTFALINVYRRDSSGSIYHFDLYRLEKWQEMLDIGYEDYFYSGDYCFIEWPERVEQLLPDDCIKVGIAVTDDDKGRIITF